MTMAKEDDNQQVFTESTGEDARLENLGYEQGMLLNFGCVPVC